MSVRDRRNWHPADAAAWLIAVGVLSLGIGLGRAVNNQDGWQVSAWWVVLALTCWLGSWGLLSWLLISVRRRAEPRTFDAVASAISLAVLWLLIGNWASGLGSLALLSSTAVRWLLALAAAAALTLVARRIRMGTILLTTASAVALLAPVQVLLTDWPGKDSEPVEAVVAFDDREVRPSILWVVADEARYGLFFTPEGQVRDTFPNVQRLQQDSTTYTRAYSVASHTVQAIPSMLAGSADASDLGASRLNSLVTNPRILEGLTTQYAVAWRSRYLPTPCTVVPCEGADIVQSAHAPLAAAWERSWTTLAGVLIGPPLRDWLPVTVENLWDSWKYDRGTDVLEDISRAQAQHAGRPIFTFWHYLGTHTNWNRDFDGQQVFTTDDLPGQLGGGLTRDSSSALLGAQHEALERRLYAASASEFDRELGVVLDALRKSGEYANTLVIVTSDHGTAIAPGDTERRPTMSPDLMWSQVAHVPLIVKAPAQASARTVTTPRSVGQIMPTVLTHAGASVDATWDVAPPLSSEMADGIVFTAVRGDTLDATPFYNEAPTRDVWGEDDFGQAAHSPFAVGIAASDIGQPVPAGWREFEPGETRTAVGPSPLDAVRVTGIDPSCSTEQGIVLAAEGERIVGSLAVTDDRDSATGILPSKREPSRTYWCRATA